MYIHSEAEQAFLRDLAIATDNTSEYWIGITSDGEGGLQWLDGSRLTYTAWDSPTQHGRDCVRMKPSSDFLWNDRFCYKYYSYICEQTSKCIQSKWNRS